MSLGLTIAVAAVGYVLLMVLVLCMLTVAKRADDAAGPTTRPRRRRTGARERFPRKEGDRQDVA